MAFTATIADNGNTSDAFQIAKQDADKNGNVTFAIRITSGSWVAADLGIKGSLDGSTYYPLRSTSAYYGAAPLGTDYLMITVPYFDSYKLWSHQNGAITDVSQTGGPMVFSVAIPLGN